MDPVVHFEMPAKEKQRVSDFYSSVFGWQMTQLGEGMGNYLLATTTDTDQKTSRPKTPGAINGGFFEHGESGTMPHVVIAVENLAHHIEQVKQKGGTVEGDPMDIPGVGKFIMFVDTEGNRVGMLEQAPMA